MPSPFSLGLNRHGSGTAPVGDRVPDLLEEYVGTLVNDAGREPTDPTLAVRRAWTWWLIVPAVLLAAALVASFFLG
jgi:hypothetical protein